MVEKISRWVDFILAVLIALSLPGRLNAQTEAEDYMVVNRLTREDGLPDQDINGIYFDNRGYAWISTFGGGLVRYDGDSFLTYSSKTGARAIGDIVRQCREDNYGRIWIPGATLEVMDLETLTPLGDFPGMSRAWRRAHPPAALRRDEKGCIWFTSADKLFRVAFSDDGSRILVDSLQCDVPNDNLMPKVGDVEQDGSVWITLGGRFYKVRPIEGKGITKSEILPDLFIGEDNRATAFLRAGNEVWIGTMNGLYRVDLTSGQKTCYLHSDADPHSIPNNEITGLCLTEDNEIVIGTLGGVSIYNPARHAFDTYGSRANDYGNQILPGEIVRSLATRGRQIWVGLEAEGLVILQKKSLKLTNISRIETTSSPIPTTPIRALHIDSQGRLWLAATGFGVCRQVGDLLFRNYNTDNSALVSNSITAFCEDGQGRLWMGTVDGHLSYMSLSSPDVVRIPEGSKSEIARNINVILGMVYDPVNDYIWLAARSGLYFYDLKRSAFSEYSPKLPGCLGACLADGKLWVSSMEGMRIIDLNTLDSRVIEGFPMCMSPVPDGDTIWAGTYGNGLYRLDHCEAEKPDITVYSEEDGLADNQINGLLLDGMYLWITTENGLSRLDTQTGELTSYDRYDGLKSMSFCENSVAKGRDGTLYIGQKEGGFSILRSGYVSNEWGNLPNVVISGYYSKDEFHSLAYAHTVSKGEKDNDFTLKFADLSYGKRQDIAYESRIWPMDKEWSPIFGKDTHVKFGHIPGGKYQIQIRAVDKKGNRRQVQDRDQGRGQEWQCPVAGWKNAGRDSGPVQPLVVPAARAAGSRRPRLPVRALVHAVHLSEKGPPAAGSGPADERAEEAERRAGAQGRGPRGAECAAAEAERDDREQPYPHVQHRLQPRFRLQHTAPGSDPEDVQGSGAGCLQARRRPGHEPHSPEREDPGRFRPVHRAVHPDLPAERREGNDQQRDEHGHEHLRNRLRSRLQRSEIFHPLFH